jgi:hypothetical protein
MKRCLATFLALGAGMRLATADIPDTYQPPAAAKNQAATTNLPAKPAKTLRGAAATAQTLAQMQAELDQLTKSNHDLLDLLKQQQSVLEDMQYDRRLQSRQIGVLEDRLEEALNDKHQLEEKIDKLETQAATRPAVPTPPAPATANTVAAANPPPSAPITAPIIETVKTPDSDPQPATPPPATYLPPEGTDNPPGQQVWHRLFTIKGDDNRQTDVFLVRGRTWRVLWHNQDKPGKLYENTSALFINAFPRDDTIPQKVCSKLGSGGDKTMLPGPGNFYLKIEASGGGWEIAVEDLR